MAVESSPEEILFEHNLSRIVSLKTGDSSVFAAIPIEFSTTGQYRARGELKLDADLKLDLDPDSRQLIERIYDYLGADRARLEEVRGEGKKTVGVVIPTSKDGITIREYYSQGKPQYFWCYISRGIPPWEMNSQE